MKKMCKHWVGKCPTECPPGVGPGCEIVKPEKWAKVKGWAFISKKYKGVLLASKKRDEAYSTPCYILVREKDMGRGK